MVFSSQTYTVHRQSCEYVLSHQIPVLQWHPFSDTFSLVTSPRFLSTGALVATGMIILSAKTCQGLALVQRQHEVVKSSPPVEAPFILYSLGAGRRESTSERPKARFFTSPNCHVLFGTVCQQTIVQYSWWGWRVFAQKKKKKNLFLCQPLR